MKASYGYYCLEMSSLNLKANIFIFFMCLNIVADERTSHPNEITKENCENANIKKNLDLSASVIGPKLDQGSGDLILVVPMMFNKAVRSSSRVRIAGNGTKKTTGAEKGRTVKESCAKKCLGKISATEDVINVNLGSCQVIHELACNKQSQFV